MAKRFTDTEKWNDPWHRKDLKPVYKCFWDYINGKCDRAGVWKVDMDQASFFINAEVSADEALRVFGSKRIKILTPEYWQILGFIPFQFGQLSPDCRSHKDIIALVESHRVSKGFVNPFQRVKEEDKDKDIDKDKEPFKGDFEAVWKDYPRKLGKAEAARHFKAQVKTPKDFEDIQVALRRYVADIRKKGTEEAYTLHGSTWFNNKWRDWITYNGVSLPPQERAAPTFRKPEVLPPDPTAADIKEMHDQKVKQLGPCRLKECAFCTKAEAQHV